MKTYIFICKAVILVILVLIINLIYHYYHDVPKFKVGDCIRTIQGEHEEWENKTNNNPISKVLQVGHKKYHLQYVTPNSLDGYEDSFDYLNLVDDIKEKVECPK